MNLVRILALCVVFALSAFTVAANWDKDDIERALEESEGAGANFYSILGLKASATLAQIRKAYREKSLEWHPDKNPGLSNAYKRFERLGLIHKILRDERRDRYDHFLTNGFPKWRGTGYFYERYRPGLVFVVALLVAASIAAELLTKTINWRKDKARLDNVRHSAYALAWGAWYQTPSDASKAIKPKARPGEKKVRVPITGFADLPPAVSQSAIEAGNVNWDEEGEKIRKAITAAPATFAEGAAPRLLDIVVFSDGSMAATEPESLEWIPLEPMDDKDAPSLRSTWPVTLASSLFSKRTEEAPESTEPTKPTETTETDEKETKPSAAASDAGKKAPARRRKRTAGKK